jgi:large subunit ribosomal protein L24
MKKKFSNKWKASKQPRKQRKYLAMAPIHVRHELISSNLSKELRKRYGRRSAPLRKGDNVRIMVGEFFGKTGKIDEMDQKRCRVKIENIYRTKKDGTKVAVYFHPSNLQIKEMNLDDKFRARALEKPTKDITKQSEEKKNAPKKK